MPPTTLAHYEVLSLLGRGGMGEVHLARDSKLGREVALKLLPEDFATDPERLARFRREARVLASLQHPNIASIYGLEEADGRVFLAMELAQGEDLSQRIARGPVPEEDVLDIARQLASGLEEAHERGVVHRDLKPANIKVSPEGKVKILDFGLARAFAGETAGEEDIENSPTITAAMTRGVILGTAAYMSPEQARGKKVDRRADIWAFGVVLYEMLTGRRLFEGETVSDTLAAVLRADLEWRRLPENVSPGLRRLLERCLERDPLKRLRDIGEARIFLEQGAQDSSLLSSASGLLAAEPARPARGVPLWAALGFAVLLAAAGTVAGWKVLGRPQPPPLLNTTLPPPTGGSFHLLSTEPGPATISPDGTMVAYSMRDEAGKVGLYLRRLDSPDGSPISGTDGAAYPFWSADSRFLGFCADDKLKKVAVTGGPPVTLCAAENLKGGTWNRDGVILFAPDHQSGIHRVSASGGEAVEITTIDQEAREDSHRHPRFLPDGKHFLFLARTSGGSEVENRVYLGSLDGGEPRVVGSSLAAAEYSSGHLLTVREGILLAAPFDPAGGRMGDGVPLVEDILLVSRGAACAVFSSTAEGMLVYQVSTGASERALEWLGAADAQLGRVGDPGELARPRISPDGTQAVVEVLDPDIDDGDLWLVDLSSGLRTRFTFDRGSEREAIWTSDGTSILYVAEVDSTYRILTRPVEGRAGGTVLHEGDAETYVSDITPDGSTAIVGFEDAASDWSIHALDLETGELTPLAVMEGVDTVYGDVSPDGRWLAYFAAAGGRLEVYVRPMDEGPRRWQVDRDGGTYPFWGPDGKTLLYIKPSGEIVKVPVDGSRSTFRAGAPEPFARVAPPGPGGIHVSLHPDGERILHVSGEVSEDETGYLRLVTDWKRGLAR